MASIWSLFTCNLVPFVRFKYENSGKLTDTSSPPSLLQSVHQLIEASQSLLYYHGRTLHCRIRLWTVHSPLYVFCYIFLQSFNLNMQKESVDVSTKVEGWEVWGTMFCRSRRRFYFCNTGATVLERVHYWQHCAQWCGTTMCHFLHLAIQCWTKTKQNDLLLCLTFPLCECPMPPPYCLMCFAHCFSHILSLHKRK